MYGLKYVNTTLKHAMKALAYVLSASLYVAYCVSLNLLDDVSRHSFLCAEYLKLSRRETAYWALKSIALIK